MSTTQGNNQLVRSSYCEVSCSGTPRHSARDRTSNLPVTSQAALPPEPHYVVPLAVLLTILLLRLLQVKVPQQVHKGGSLVPDHLPSQYVSFQIFLYRLHMIHVSVPEMVHPHGTEIRPSVPSSSRQDPQNRVGSVGHQQPRGPTRRSAPVQDAAQGPDQEGNDATGNTGRTGFAEEVCVWLQMVRQTLERCYDVYLRLSICDHLLR